MSDKTPDEVKDTRKDGSPVATNPNHNPPTILARTSVAKTLTISDQHANVLLTLKSDKADDKEKDSKEDEPAVKNALLKITLVPFHKADLARIPQAVTDEENDALRLEEETKHSNNVLAFLSKFDWRMTSESGAEYSFHEAFPKAGTSQEAVEEPPVKKTKVSEATTQENAPATMAGSVFKAELIYPASDRQVSRAMPSPGLALITETAEMYQAVTKPFIDGVVSSGSLSWLQNVVQVKKEKERLLWNADGWILNIDTKVSVIIFTRQRWEIKSKGKSCMFWHYLTIIVFVHLCKWRNHPDALTVPRNEWLGHESTADLYCLGILKQGGVASLRDLTGDDHLPVLREMLEQGPKVIEEVYGVKKNQLRIFVHYQPQFYHFHVHFTRLENDIGAQVKMFSDLTMLSLLVSALFFVLLVLLTFLVPVVLSGWTRWRGPTCSRTSFKTWKRTQSVSRRKPSHTS